MGMEVELLQMQHGLEIVHCTGDPWELQDLPARENKKDCLLFTERKKQQYTKMIKVQIKFFYFTVCLQL